jgi:hypothetical protein
VCRFSRYPRSNLLIALAPPNQRTLSNSPVLDEFRGMTPNSKRRSPALLGWQQQFDIYARPPATKLSICSNQAHDTGFGMDRHRSSGGPTIKAQVCRGILTSTDFPQRCVRAPHTRS